MQCPLSFRVKQVVLAESGGGSIFQMGRRALQLAIYSVASFRSADDLLLFNALALRSGQVLRTLRQEASQEDYKVCKHCNPVPVSHLQTSMPR